MLARVYWWLLNIKLGPWGATNPLDPRTWRVDLKPNNQTGGES